MNSTLDGDEWSASFYGQFKPPLWESAHCID